MSSRSEGAILAVAAGVVVLPAAVLCFAVQGVGVIVDSQLRAAELRAQEERRREAIRQQVGKLKETHRAENRKRALDQSLNDVNSRLAAIQSACRRLGNDVTTFAFDYLNDQENYGRQEEQYERLVSRKDEIRGRLHEIVLRPPISSPEEGRRVVDALECELRSITRGFKTLAEEARSITASEMHLHEFESAHRRFKQELDNGLSAFRDVLRIIPAPPNPRDGEQFEHELQKALAYMELYLYGERSLYISRDGRQHVNRTFYSVIARAQSAERDSDLLAADLRMANHLFEVSIKARLDAEVYKNQKELKEAYQKYFALCEMLGYEAKSLEAVCAQMDLVDAIEFFTGLANKLEEIEKRRRTNEYIHNAIEEAVQELGVSVTAIANMLTPGGNRSSLYQFEDGTAMKAYTDAKGSIMFEVGGLVRKNSELDEELSKEQLEQMQEARRHHCSITLQQLTERLRQKGIIFQEARGRRKEPEEHEVVLFSLEEFAHADTGVMESEAVCLHDTIIYHPVTRCRKKRNVLTRPKADYAKPTQERGVR